MKILHVVPHLGVVAVPYYISSIRRDPDREHRVICLDTISQKSLDYADRHGWRPIGDMSKKLDEVLALIAESDVVLVHWWNHPLLYDFLVREPLPPCRLVFWSHTSGTAPPNCFTDKVLKYPDKFIFTTPMSYDVKEVCDLQDKSHLGVIWSTGGLDRIKHVKPVRHRGFRVGYIGLVDYAKMHPDFLAMSADVEVPDVKFIVVGGPDAFSCQMAKEAARLGIGDKFEFTGYVSEDKKWELLSTFDVFGYPLAPYHYGTCDFALQEAMGAGVVPVVLSNPMESYMVKNGETGIVVSDVRGYAEAVQLLREETGLRNRLSMTARAYAWEMFSLEKMAAEWNVVFDELMKMPKLARQWDINRHNGKILSRDIFIESLGSHGEVFHDHYYAPNAAVRADASERIKALASLGCWRSKTKATAHQYDAFLPGDPYLSTWSRMMEAGE